jgi:hypothetical protein
MVGYEHDVAGHELRVYRTRSIGHDERLSAKRMHDLHGKDDLRRGVAFLSVQAALHTYHLLTGEFTKDEPPHMAGRARLLEMRNIPIVNGEPRIDPFRKPSQP